MLGIQSRARIRQAVILKSGFQNFCSFAERNIPDFAKSSRYIKIATYHKCRAAESWLPKTVREESFQWLKVHGYTNRSFL